MRSKPAASDVKAFLQAAVVENMLTTASARDLAQKQKQSDKPIAELAIELGRLKPIQADAIHGLIAPTEVAPGYEVLGLLGHGAIGIVYRARQPGLDREVALKTIGATRLSGGDASGTTAVARFKQEAVAVAKLKHPNIVAAYDYGASGERMHLAMEMVDGVDLESLIETAGKIDEQTAWQLARQVAAALAHAVELGIIHRDIKPANLLLTEPPAGYPLPAGVPLLKVTDFGLARLNAGPADEQATRLTHAGATMGTPHYMAPEQIDDADVGFHADIYALGATVYHMIAGKPPFAGRSMMKVFAAKMAGDEDPIEELPDEVTQPTRNLLRTMLAHDATNRPQGYNELLASIADVLQDASFETAVTAPTTLLIPPPSPSTGERGNASVSLQLTSNTRRGRLIRLGGITLLAVVAGAYGLITSRGPEPPPRRLYEVDHDHGAYVSLFNGSSVLGWRGRPVILSPLDGEHPRTLTVAQQPLSRPLTKSLASLSDPERYGIVFSVALGDARALEVHYEDQAGESTGLLRITQDTATVGHATTDGDFEALSPTTPLANSDTAWFFRVERGATHWFVYQTSPQQQLVGWGPIEGEPGTPLRFRALDGQAYVGDVELVSLKPLAP